MLEEHQYTQAALAETIGKSRSHVANTLRLLKLPDEVKALVRDGKLSAGHARALVTVTDPVGAARRIVEAGLSVRDAEGMGNDGPGAKPKRVRATARKDPDTLALEKSLSDRLGLAVVIDHKPSGGEIRVAYRTLEQLDDVCRRLRG